MLSIIIAQFGITFWKWINMSIHSKLQVEAKRFLNAHGSQWETLRPFGNAVETAFPQISKIVFFFLLKIIIFYVFRSFWYVDLKNDFLKNENIILMHF
jgi:hypothetical protein